MTEEITDYNEKLNKMPDSIEKLIWINELVQKIQIENPIRAIAVLEDAVTLGEKLYQQDESVAGYLLNNCFSKAVLYFHTGNYTHVINCVYRALPMLLKHKDEILHGKLLNILAAANFHLGNTAEGFQFSWQALEILEKTKEPFWITTIYNNLGLQYLNMQNYEWAERYFFQAIERLQGFDEKSKAYAEVYNNLCQLYLETKQYQKAMDYGNQAVDYYRQSHDSFGQADTLINLGQVYQTIKNIQLAKHAYEEALTLTRKYNLRFLELNALIRLGEVCIEEKETETAFLYLRHGLSLAEDIGAKRELYKLHRLLSRVYKQESEFALSLEHFEQFYRIEQQVLDDKEKQRIKSLEIINQVESTRKDVEQYRTKSRVLEQKLEKQQVVQENLEKLTITDPLTGLYNRRHFDKLIHDELTHATLSRSRSAFIMLDIDHFKAVNDQFGHLAGDQVLVTLASLMREELRQFDLIWRIGGEEFVIFLPETKCKQAILVAERFRTRIAEKTFSFEENEVQLTVSLGVACTEDPIVRLTELFDQADQAMYAAKQAGRNQVASYRG